MRNLSCQLLPVFLHLMQCKLQIEMCSVRTEQRAALVAGRSVGGLRPYSLYSWILARNPCSTGLRAPAERGRGRALLGEVASMLGRERGDEVPVFLLAL